ncbi:GNAT family N-acetyltransferase [Aureispira sp. CCB-QB1]|uniref:GNAT family N-acetyltransferase n=1 Tax=Aureispira sp. CCB-QB1 TaxID=1313421 RepID=UPI000698D15D|nr:GNAT family N-acetyltransferase [Aureispira sp. CCB-QB1]
MKASKRLHFRSLTTEDTTALIRIYSDAEAMKFRANPPLLNEDEALQMIKKATQEAAHFSSKRWAIVKNDTNELIGTCVLTYDKQEPTCTIGYSIGKMFWNKGYGKELLHAMVQEVRTTNCKTIKAFVHPQNLASIAILEKEQFYQADASASENLLTYCLNIML